MHARLLIVKLSSLGDVIQAMPVIADLRRLFDQRRQPLVIDWAVEEDYQELVSLHPGIDCVIPVGLRRWRKKGLFSALRDPLLRAERLTLRHRLSQTRYEAVIDLQGLIKSAWVAQMAVGPRHGWNTKAAREALASLTYQHRYAAPRYDAMHAVARYRELCAQVMGYAGLLADWPLDYGFWPSGPEARAGLVHRPRTDEAARSGSILFLHGSARAEKLWPEANWIGLGRALMRFGVSIELGWGNDEERERAWRIARAIGSGRGSGDGLAKESNAGLEALQVDARKLSLEEWPSRLTRLRAVVGVDSGLLFLALACAVPALGIYLATDPGHVGLSGQSPHRNLGGKFQTVSIEEVLNGLQSLNVLGSA